MKKRLVTSALPYVNNVPHLGNIIQVLSADAFARFCRLRGYETCYVCGTDEYGTATETRAAEEGISARELCDRYFAIHSSIYKWFNIAFDKFGRTSTPVQSEIVQNIFKKLDANGYITEKTIEQLYCPACERFLADRYVRGSCPSCGSSDARGDQCEVCGKLLEPTDLKDPRCATCGASPELRSTKQLYIDLPKLKDKLEKWIKTASVDGRWAKNAIRMTEAWIRDGLRERAITRDLKWGISVPKVGFEDKVFYVWFDAPIGYVSITAGIANETERQDFVDRWWKDPSNTELFQFIGKDNIPFHTVVFPSSQLGTGENWTMLHHMSSSEYLNYEGGKFSKSKGIGVFGTDAMESGIPADVWRFYIFYNRPERSDALFTWKDFAEKVNSELIGNLANLVNRTLSFVTRYYEGIIPQFEGGDDWDTVLDYEAKITEKLEWAELRDAYHLIFELSSFANKIFQDGEPWRKRTENPSEAALLIGKLCYIVRDLSILISPYTPETAAKISSFFGKESVENWNTLGKKTGLDRVVKSEVLFAKLENDNIKTLRERYSGSQKERNDMQDKVMQDKVMQDKPVESTQSAAERFSKTLDIRVAKIVSIEKHPKADKLYIEKLDIAGEERTIVSGLVPHYKEEELLNKKIFVAYNLKEAKLRGVLSRGMLLAASCKNEDGSETVEALDAGDAPLGSRVTIENADGNPPLEIDIDTFFSVPINVKDNIVNIEGKPLLIDGKQIKAAKITCGDVG
jgi:methionyl-tRNA synthetase